MRIDPSKFFELTAIYPTQSRGTFQITKVPEWVNTLDRLPFTEEEKDDVRRSFAPMGPLRTGLLARSTNLPPQTVGTDDYAFYGPTRKHAHTLIFSDIEVEFLLMGHTVTDARAVRRTMLLWQEFMVGNREAGKVPRSDSTAFAVEYYDNYVAEAVLLNYGTSPSDTNDKPLIRTHFSEMFPVSVGGLQTAWASPDEPMTMSVTFTYFHSKIW